MRRSLDPADSARLLNGGPVVLVTTRYRDQTDVMPVIWHTPLSRSPALIGIIVHAGRHTHDMIRFSEEFALNFPARDLVNHTQYFGMVSGDNVTKLELTNLPTFAATKIEVPLIEGCVAWIECSLVNTFPVGDHTLFVGQVLVVQAEEESFEETWKLGDNAYRPLHYLGLDRYAILGDALQAELRTDEDGTIALDDTDEQRERNEEADAREQERRQREGL